MSESPSPAKDRELRELLSVALTMLQDRFGVVIGGTLFFSFVPLLAFIPAIVSLVTSGVFTSGENFEPAKLLPFLSTLGLSTLVYLLMYFTLRVGWIAICLKICKAEAAPFSEFFSNFNKLPNFLLVHLILGIAISLGFLLLVAPGVYLSVRLCLAPYLVMDREIGAIEAIQESWRLSDGIAMKIFLAGVAFVVANIVVSFVPLIGSIAQFFVIGYYDLLLAAIYRDKNGDLIAE